MPPGRPPSFTASVSGTGHLNSSGSGACLEDGCIFSAMHIPSSVTCVLPHWIAATLSLMMQLVQPPSSQRPHGPGSSGSLLPKGLKLQDWSSPARSPSADSACSTARCADTSACWACGAGWKTCCNCGGCVSFACASWRPAACTCRREAAWSSLVAAHSAEAALEAPHSSRAAAGTAKSIAATAKRSGTIGIGSTKAGQRSRGVGFRSSQLEP
mmetsp:Transcript_127433/g.366521  ORF Transcript_127433/g.366521 Transcript_127433/m.366521 type:complete len:213 (-) Transcript_127433:18-656(-)